jgi:hypothetical protein
VGDVGHRMIRLHPSLPDAIMPARSWRGYACRFVARRVFTCNK